MPWSMLLIGYLPWFLGTGTALFLGVRFARAIERRGVRQEEHLALQARVAELESMTNGLSAALERVEAGEKFTRELLGTRVRGEGERTRG